MAAGGWQVFYRIRLIASVRREPCGAEKNHGEQGQKGEGERYTPDKPAPAIEQVFRTLGRRRIRCTSTAAVKRHAVCVASPMWLVIFLS